MNNNDLWLAFPNEKEINAFAKLYEKEFGKKLTYEEAKETATRLLHIHWVLSFEGEVDPKDWPKT